MLEICEAPVIDTGTVYGPPPTRNSLLGGDRINWPEATRCPATAAAGTDVVPGIGELPGGITDTPAGGIPTGGALPAVCAAAVGGGNPGVAPTGPGAAPIAGGAPGATTGAPAGAPAGTSPAAASIGPNSGGGPDRPRFAWVPM